MKAYRIAYKWKNRQESRSLIKYNIVSITKHDRVDFMEIRNFISIFN